MFMRHPQAPIERSTLIEEIVEKYPELVRPLRARGIVCIRCGEPIWGTLEQVAASKGIDNVDAIVAELNRVIARQREAGSA